MNVLSCFDGISCGQLALNRAGIFPDIYYASEIEKSAIGITQYNFPDTIQLGDITKIKGSNLPKIHLLMGGSPCFAAGTQVITNNGYKTIEKISIGDFVLTHKNRYKQVIKTGKRYNINTVILKAQGILPTRTTKEHPYYARKIKKVWDNTKKARVRIFNDPEWIEVKDLTKEHYIGLPILNECNNKFNLSNEDCWLLGRYVADGYTRLHKRKERKNSYIYQTIFCIGKKKIDQFKSKVSRNITYVEERTAIKAQLSSKEFLKLANLCGNGAENKVIPQFILELPLNLLQEFLDGYMSGDGSYRKNEFRATSVSAKLCMSLNLAIAKVYNTNSGIEFTKRPKTTIIEGRIVNQKDTYSISFRKEMLKQTHAIIDLGIVWLPIKEIISSDTKETVYNIEVKDDNSYTANNAIVHNCQGFSIAGRGLNFQDPRSKLFFEFVRLIDECKPTYFLLENVKMKKEWRDIITQYLKVEPVIINSSLLSAQNRERMYWANFPITQPEDKKIFLRDVIFDDASEPALHNIYGGFKEKEPRTFWDKSPTLRTAAGGGHIPSLILTEKALKYMDRTVKDGRTHWDFMHHSDVNDPKSHCVTANFHKGVPYNVLVDKKCIRYFHPIECERLQTLWDNYTRYGIIDGKTKENSKTTRYKAIGNGWTVDIIAHIFKGLNYGRIRKIKHQM